MGGLPETLHLKLLEPLRELFKDEVRALGVELGLPREMVFRHPFPGPGLGVRILGEVKREYAELLRRADAIFIEELRAARTPEGVSWYDQVAQAFAVFLPVRSVGVMGDGRTYELRGGAARGADHGLHDGATGRELPYDLLGKVSSRIINEVRGINRVVYDISSQAARHDRVGVRVRAEGRMREPAIRPRASETTLREGHSRWRAATHRGPR